MKNTVDETVKAIALNTLIVSALKKFSRKTTNKRNRPSPAITL